MFYFIQSNLSWSIILGSALIIGIFFGVAAAATRYCHMGAVSDWVISGNMGRMQAWMLSLAIIIAGVTLFEYVGWIDLDHTRMNYRMSYFPIFRYLLGGILFGVGMCLAGGCPTRTLVSIGHGSLRSLYSYSLIGLTAYFLLKWPSSRGFMDAYLTWPGLNFESVGITHQDLGSILAHLLNIDEFMPLVRLLVGVLVIAIIAFWIKQKNQKPINVQDIWGGVLIGLAVLAGWVFTASPLGQNLMSDAAFSFVAPVGTGTQSISFISPASETLGWLASSRAFNFVSFGMAAMIGVVLGAFAWFVVRGEFHLSFFISWADFFRHTLGGILMGGGGVIAMGCSVGQGLTGASTLAIGSLLATASIILGAFLTLKIWFYREVYQSSWMMSVKATLIDLGLLKRADHPFGAHNVRKSSPPECAN